ncbi:unnamed protein product [Rotaria socialis]
MTLPDKQVEYFSLETVLYWSSNNFIFLKGEEISDSQSMELCLESYLERWLNVAENLSSCLLALLSRLQTIKWSHLSLVRVLYSLQTFALNHQNQSLLNDEHIKIFSSLILTQFNTYAPVLQFLSSEDLNASLDTRLFSLDNTLLEYRQTAFLLDLLDIRNTDILKTIFNPLIENIRTAYQRPYMSINNVRRSIELFSGLIQENYFHSSNFIKDWLSSSIRLVVRESLNFIKIHSIKQSIAFAKLPIVFLMVGNHEDISHFTNEWNPKFRILPLFSKLLPLLDQPNISIPQADMLIAKHLLIANNISSVDLCDNIIDDLFKASPRELYLMPFVLSAVSYFVKHKQRMKLNWFTKMLENCGHVSGIVNVIFESTVPIWLQEHRIQSSHLPILIECVIFGQIYQKDKKQQWQAEQHVEQDESIRLLITSSHIIPEYRYDRNIRVLIQLFLLHMWPSLLNVQQNDIVMQAIEKHRCLASKERRPRFCTNSLEHRIMFRSLQCLHCLTSVIKNSRLLKIICDYTVDTLTRENEPSLRLLAEWIIVRLISEDRITCLNDLYENYLKNAHQHRTGTVCAWISIAPHIPTSGKYEAGTTQDEEGSSTIQHKANPYPVVEALDDTELRANIKRTQLIVVASLIDKQANLDDEKKTTMTRP